MCRIDTHMAEMYDLWCLLGNVMRSMVREGAIEGVNVDEFMRLHRAERDALDRLDVIDLALGASQHRENRRPFSYRLNADNTARILRMRRLRDKRARVGVLCSALDRAQADALRAELHTHTLHLIQLGSQYERDCAEAEKDRLYADELQLRQLRLLRERGLAL